MSGTVPVSLRVNGVEHSLEAEPRLLLVHALRDHLGLAPLQNPGQTAATRAAS